jgi:hypothetical protein
VVTDDPNQKPLNDDETPEPEARQTEPQASPEEKADTGATAVVNSSEAVSADAVAGTPDALLAEPSVAEPEPSCGDTSPDEVEPSFGELNAAVLADSRKHTRRSFVVAAAAAVAGYSLYHWLDHLPPVEMQPEAYREAFETNAAISRAIFDERALSPTYAVSKAETIRVNGVYGLKKMLEPTSYRLQLVGSAASVSHPRYSHDVTSWEYTYIDEKTMEDQGHDTKTPPPSALTSEKMPPKSMLEVEKRNENRSGRRPRGKEEAGESLSTLAVGTSGLLLKMEDILKLPRHELVTQFKCIEGWSQIVHWAGVRMADFLEAYPPALIQGKEPKYVYMETPDGDFYNGYDLQVCRHPQTLLVTEMMGARLTQYHGAPLRLHMPTKYGYKQIKRIGLISYTDSKPDDYWTKLGYDWHGGL